MRYISVEELETLLQGGVVEKNPADKPHWRSWTGPHKTCYYSSFVKEGREHMVVAARVHFYGRLMSFLNYTRFVCDPVDSVCDLLLPSRAYDAVCGGISDEEAFPSNYPYYDTCFPWSEGRRVYKLMKRLHEHQ